MAFWHQRTIKDPQIWISRTRNSRLRNGCYLGRHSARRAFYSETKPTTLHSNSSVVSKLIWLELNLNLSHAYFEKRLLDCQCSTGVGSNVTIRNQSVSE